MNIFSIIILGALVVHAIEGDLKRLFLKFTYLQFYHPFFVKHFLPVIFIELYYVLFSYYNAYFKYQHK